MKALIVLLILVLISIGYYSSYIGYSGYEKDKYSRFSESVRESKEREVFIKQLEYLVIPDSIVVRSVFIERQFRWGSNSNQETEIIEDDHEEQFQVVVEFPTKQFNQNILILPLNSPENYKPVILLDSIALSDTVFFNIISTSLDKKINGIVKVWQGNETN